MLAAAYLARLWCWALDAAPAGDLSGILPVAVEAGAGWDGRKGALMPALLASGWADSDPIRLHDWDDFAGRLALTRDDNRARARERMRRLRSENAKCSGRTEAERSANKVQMFGGTVPDPTVPYRTEPKSESESKSKPLAPLAASPARAARGSRLSADWFPDADLTAYARDLGLDTGRITADFRDYWHAIPGAKGVKLDWPATWRGWCRREADRKPSATVRQMPNRNAPPRISEPTQADMAADLAKIRAELRGAKP